MAEAVYSEAKTRKGYRARRKLLQAAAEVFSERGKEGTSVLAVCERADVGRTSFYNYFETIDELIDAVANELISDFAAGMSETYHGLDRGVDRLAGCLRFCLERAHADPTWARLVMQLDAVSNDVRAVFDEGGRPDVEGSIASGAFSLTRRDIPVFLNLMRAATIAAGRDLSTGHADRTVIPQVVAMVLCAGGMKRSDAQQLAGKPLPKAAHRLLTGPWER